VKLFLKNKNNIFAKNHCEIKVRTILVCALYSIKYGKQSKKELIEFNTKEFLVTEQK
jgi:hypothetical protein